MKSLDIIVLIVNSFNWLFVAYIIKKRYGYNNIGVFYLLFYSFLSVLSIHIYLTMVPKEIPCEGISLLPLIYMELFIVLFSTLLVKHDTRDKLLIQPPSLVFNVLCIVVIILSLLEVRDILQNFAVGFTQLLVDDEYGAGLYDVLSREVVHSARDSGPLQYLAVLSNQAEAIAPVLFLFYLTRPKRNILITIGLALATFITFAFALSTGRRSSIIQQLFSMGVMFLYLRHYYSTKVIKYIRPVFLSVIGIIMTGFMFLSISRANSFGGSVVSFFERYAGQSFLYFGKYGFDNGEIRNGDRTFPLVKSIFTKDVARSYYDRESKYTKMKINESTFVTFVGDFVFDYGIIGAAIVLFFIYLLLRQLLIGCRKILYFDQVLIVYLLINILNGFYLYPLCDFAGNMFFFSLIILSMFFKSFRIKTSPKSIEC